MRVILSNTVVSGCGGRDRGKYGEGTQGSAIDARMIRGPRQKRRNLRTEPSIVVSDLRTLASPSGHFVRLAVPPVLLSRRRGRSSPIHAMV